MSRGRQTLQLLLLLGPVALERVLVAALDQKGAAGVMLGAVADSSAGALALTAGALLLRLYVIVLLPALATYLLVATLLWQRGR